MINCMTSWDQWVQIVVILLGIDFWNIDRFQIGFRYNGSDLEHESCEVVYC